MAKLIQLEFPDLATRVISLAHSNGLPLSARWITLAVQERERESMSSVQAPSRGARENIIGLQKSDYKGGASTLCAGCGHDSISSQIIAACYDVGVPPKLSSR